ncbi:F-box/LRR-repeat protein 25-like [Durio zibethinus]|uniref:F-box/LRR-repeat protein 25-like n=1 Tax=Durio zibethinus TaxID=66656 RepID=A0A6P5Y970_DURZI|nr:F-box/LRR-repeat protein 25-like [Durio zibethinus]
MMAGRDEKKAKNHEDEEEAKDRLSDLPDCVLLHILSFLPETKWSVRTSVLSKRWKCLWASLPDLIFNGWGCDTSFFKKFVRRVLSGRNNLPVSKFFFHYLGADKSLVTRIINYSVSHNVQHFSIGLKFTSIRILFPLFSRCRSLKTLELEYFRELILLRDFSLPTLTTLHICSCSFCSHGSTRSIDPFLSLVNLKSLQLKDCNMAGVTSFKISGPQLHSLAIRQHCLWNGCKVEIFAPKLHSFLFIDTMPVEFSNLDFPLLEIAEIDAYLPDSEELFEKSHLNLINLFRGLYHAESLHVSSNTIEVLMELPVVLEAQASPFGRLKTLNIECCIKSFIIPDNVMNYFVSGSTFGENVSIEIQELSDFED